MKRIIITEHQASLLNKLKAVTEAEEAGIKSVDIAIGEKVVRVVISGENLIKFKDRILALITRQDPEARVGYFEATGKIVGNVKKIRLDSIERDLKSLEPTITIQEKPITKSLKEKEHRVQQHDFTTQPTTQGAIGLKIVRIRITGNNVEKLKDVIVKEIRNRDPESTVAYVSKTGRIVGEIHLNILKALEVYLKTLDPTLKIEQIYEKNLIPVQELSVDPQGNLVPDDEPTKLSHAEMMEYIKLPNVRAVVPVYQFEVIANGLRGEEQDHFKQVFIDINQTVSKMPKVYETDNIKLKDKIVYLHYFYRGSDWYIVEKDSEQEQLQAFGYAILNGDTQNAELGYISIEELKQIRGVELDLHWTPKKLGEILGLTENSNKAITRTDAFPWNTYDKTPAWFGFNTVPTSHAAGLTKIRVVVSAPDLKSNKDRAIALITRQDPTATVAYFIPTGKIVGNVSLRYLRAIQRDLKDLDPNISIEKKPISKSLKITKEQYDRLLKKMKESTTVKGGLDRVDKTFKKAFAGKNVQNLGEDKFNIKKPNSSVPKLPKDVGHRTNNINESVDEFNNAVFELIRFLYGKADYLSPFWEENGISYNMLINTLFKKGIIIKSDGGYELSKSLGSTHLTPELAIDSVKKVLYSLLQPQEVDEQGLNRNPQYTTPTIPKNKFFQTIAMNPEIAILKDIKGGYYVFNYTDLDKKDFEEYAAIEKSHVGWGDENEPDFDYSDDFEINGDVIDNYVNDNITKIPTGDGLDAFESGVMLVRIDDALKNELITLYDKDKIITSALSAIGKDPDVDIDEMTSTASSGQFTGPMSSTKEEIKSPEEVKPALVKALASINTVKRTPEAIKAALKKKREEELNRRKETGEVDEVVGKPVELFNINNVVEVTDKIKEGIKTPYKRVQFMRIDDMVDSNHIFKVYIMVSLDSKDTWENGIVHNSRYSQFTLNRNGIIEQISFNYKLGKKFRKTKVKSIDDAINKLNNYFNEINNLHNVKEMTGAASSGAFTGPMSGPAATPVVKRNIIPEEEPIDEMTTAASSGQYTANAFPNIDRNGKFKNESKTPAEVHTQYPKGEFVKMGKCTKYDNGKGAENGGCSQGAVDNVVTYKKSKDSVISPSLDENAIFEEISKKTGKTVEEVKTIIKTKNIKSK